MVEARIYPKKDEGSGSVKDYGYDLRPASKGVSIVLAGSNEYQDAIADVASRGHSELEVFVPRRTAEEERTDAPIPIRFFVDSRMSGVVGWVPTGLEAPVIEAVSRLDKLGKNARIPAEIVKSRHGLRVKVLIGLTR